MLGMVTKPTGNIIKCYSVCLLCYVCSVFDIVNDFVNVKVCVVLLSGVHCGNISFLHLRCNLYGKIRVHYNTRIYRTQVYVCII